MSFKIYSAKEIREMDKSRITIGIKQNIMADVMHAVVNTPLDYVAVGLDLYKWHDELDVIVNHRHSVFLNEVFQELTTLGYRVEEDINYETCHYIRWNNPEEEPK